MKPPTWLIWVLAWPGMLDAWQLWEAAAGDDFESFALKAVLEAQGHGVGLWEHLDGYPKPPYLELSWIEFEWGGEAE